MDITQKPFHQVVIEALLEADENKLREIAWWLVRTALPPDAYKKVRKAWFERCYMIKFADHELINNVTIHLSDQEKKIKQAVADLAAIRWAEELHELPD